MSLKKNPKEKVASYEMLSAWDEVVLGDKELFREMTEACIPALIRAARKDIRRERLMGQLPSDLLHAEELVGEALIEAWSTRHGRNPRKPLRDWLLEIQQRVLQEMVEEERMLCEPLVLSLEEPVPSEAENDENELLRHWIEPPAHDCWQDVIPDDQRLAA